MKLLLPASVVKEIIEAQQQSARISSVGFARFMFHVAYQDEVAKFCRLLDEVEARLLEVRKPGKPGDIMRGWDIVYEHTEEIGMEQKC